LNAPDAFRQPISVGHQWAKSSSSMIARNLGGARTSSTTNTSPGHSAANSVSAATPPQSHQEEAVCPSTDSGTIAEMDARSRPELNDPFEEAIDDALSSLPADLRAAMSNVEIVVEDEPPDGQPLLGLYRGVPLPRRSSTYSAVLPDKISIFDGPITRLAAGDSDRLRREVRHVVLHEIAHHFGISDERLIELDRY
jgi:predicted Zn-dependent protease with MMP-like domain